MPDSRGLRSLLAAVSDRTSVDWMARRAEAQSERQQSLVGSLQVVARIAEAHRTLAPDAERSELRTRSFESAADPGAAILSEAVPPASAPRRWGHLELLERVGEGAFGEVYRARDTRLDREVALKLLRPTARPRTASEVLREGRLLARVRHPNVATVFGAEEREGRVGLWMEFVRGRTLAESLKEQGPFGAREAIGIGIDVCRALTAVHRAGVIHRDVKAQNVMREEGGRILLMDLGAGREMLADLPADRSISGTPMYMAPEILDGRDPTVRSDVYSLGVLLFHVVSGAFPVEARSLGELVETHRRGEVRLLRELRPDLPEVFLRVVEQALAANPEHRFPSAGRMEQALAAALGTSAPDSAWKLGASAKRLLQIAAMLLVAAGVVGLGVTVLRRPQGPAPDTVSESATTREVSGSSAAVQVVDADTRHRIARLHDRAALLEALGSYDEAEQVLLAGVRDTERMLGTDDPLVAEGLTRLAWIVRATGDRDRAMSLYSRATEVLEQALGVAEQTLDAGDPRIAAALEELARVHSDRGDPDAARPLLERAAAIRHTGPGTSAGPVVAVSLEQLGVQTLASRGYTVEAALYRREHRADQRLASGDHVAPDDRLFLELRASAPLHVYVVDEDDRGEAYLLFPMPGYDLGNPLAADTTHHLPGRRASDGARSFWQVSSAGGREHFLVVASPERLLEFEEVLNRLPVATSDELIAAAPLSESTTTRLRGIGRIAVEPDAPARFTAAGADRLFELARQLAANPETVRGVWIRQIDLENPPL